MERKEYLANYMTKVSKILVDQLSQQEMIDESLFQVDELEELWSEIAPEYMVDAVPEIAKYPVVSIAWACYVGMGVASMWDKEQIQSDKNIYVTIRSARGFDELDEFVTEELLGLSLHSEEGKKLQEAVRSAAQTALTMLRRENIEPQSTDAFYAYAENVKLFYSLGISIALKGLGYKYEKVEVDLPHTSQLQ